MPLRILLVNWARPWLGTALGGGVNGYAQSLALALAGRGHDVSWLCAGVTYQPAEGDEHDPGPLRIARHDDWRSIRVFEVINSPVLAPSLHQFRRPRLEIRSARLTAELRTFARLLRPDVVHVHNIEGLAADALRAFAEPDASPDADPPHNKPWPGARLVYSLHNYHTLCPQVYLMRHHRVPCRDYDNGHACKTCINAPAVMETRRLRAGEGAAETFPIPLVTSPAHIDDPLPRTNDDRDQPPPPPAPPPRKAPPPPHLEPLDNTVPAPSSSERPPANYAARRAAMIDMLNRCDRVLAVSTFVRDLYASMGVDPARLQVMPIGTRAVETARRHAHLLAPPPPFDPPRPLRLVFLGQDNYFKGLPMLADTLETLPQADLARLDVTIAASNLDASRFRALPLANLKLLGSYTPDDIPAILAGRDVGIVPSVWWDNAPQTVFEMLACGLPVLAANVGGIPDFITHGVNGILFRANDRADLAAKLGDLLADPGRTTALRSRIRPPKTMDTHVDELQDLYIRLAATI